MSTPPDEAAPEPRAEVSLHRRVSFGLFALLLAAAVAFYLWWGIGYGDWLDNGVYAVTIVLVLFGLAGMWLVAPTPPAAAPDRPAGPG
ncbi:MAG TPA: hypothetical protein VLX64_01050 [Thermoplasmata archaeon]|nr:hypothetical protein [Thermoplasmata archaeon]HUJ77571.1 hypothetical protein [Thermoplasmata archaeon]